jgi:hypothetical protein
MCRLRWLDGNTIFLGPTTAARVLATPVPVTLDGDGDLQFVPQHLAYAARGPNLAHLSLYEYVATVRPVKKKIDRGSDCYGFDSERDDDPNDPDLPSQPVQPP